MGAVASVVDTVTNAVSDVADFVTDQIIEPVVETVEKVVESPQALATVALAVAAPGVGTALGTALGASGTAATVLGNAVIGGTVAQATGGDFTQGALSAGAGSLLGTTAAPVTSAISQELGSQALGQALTSGAISELQGGDFLKGAVTGGVSGAVNDAKLALAEDYLQSVPPSASYENAPTEKDVLAAMGQPVATPNQDGTQTFTYDDGSTLTVDPNFNVVASTNAIDSVLSSQPADISNKLAALDVTKAVLPVVGALTAGSVINAISQNPPSGYEIQPVPAEWRSPEYNMAFTPSAPIDFGTRELLKGTQWESPVNLSGLISMLNQPVISQQTQQMMTQFQAPATPYQTGISDIIGSIGGQPVSIADIISGIQSGQSYSG